MSDELTARIFRFESFEVDEGAGELRKRGIRIKLHAQPFRILLLLLEHPQELVTREQLRAHLWGEKTFVDFDHGLNTAVNKLREALGDSALRPRYVETVAGKGYRFIAPVQSAAPSALGPLDVVADITEPETAGSAPSVSDGGHPVHTLLAAPQELPAAPRRRVRLLLQLVQFMYLAFYLGALANLGEIRDILSEAHLASAESIFLFLITTAATLIPVRLFLFTAVSFESRLLADKFRKLFPILLVFDLLWSLSPFLLVHHVSVGFALGLTAALIYMPFAQRSLILMYVRHLS